MPSLIVSGAPILNWNRDNPVTRFVRTGEPSTTRILSVCFWHRALIRHATPKLSLGGNWRYTASKGAAVPRCSRSLVRNELVSYVRLGVAWRMSASCQNQPFKVYRPCLDQTKEANFIYWYHYVIIVIPQGEICGNSRFLKH